MQKVLMFLGGAAAVCSVLWWRGAFSSSMRILPPSTGEEAIYFHDQRAGERFEGVLAVFRTSGFVVVQEWADDKAGAVVGVSELLPAGRSENFSLYKDRTMVAGEVLVATLYEDTNGDRMFTDGQDAVLRDAAGDRVFAVFRIVE